MALALNFILRGAQGFLALLILCLMAYVVHQWNYWTGWSPSRANFLLFTSVWTLLAVIYLFFAPIHAPRTAHKFAILGVEVVTNIFWFAGWVALAVLLGDSGCGRTADVCRVAEAAVVFAAIEWLLFCATTIMAALHVVRSRNGDNYVRKDPAAGTHHNGVHASV